MPSVSSFAGPLVVPAESAPVIAKGVGWGAKRPRATELRKRLRDAGAAESLLKRLSRTSLLHRCQLRECKEAEGSRAS